MCVCVVEDCPARIHTDKYSGNDVKKMVSNPLDSVRNCVSPVFASTCKESTLQPQTPRAIKLIYRFTGILVQFLTSDIYVKSVC
jgi:hypothetical protein